MTAAAAVLLVAPFHRHLNEHHTGVATAFLIILGLAAMATGWVGWRHAEQIVPTSLPESLYHRRTKVVRRGAASFGVVGVGVLVLGVLLGTVG